MKAHHHGRLILGVLCVLSGGEFFVVTAQAQIRRPKADVTPLVERPGLHAGDTARVALRVSLPEGLHTQSNKPRDPLLIPTELTIDAPIGVTVKEVVFPPSTDLKQAGQDQPLAVFEQTFGIGVQREIAPPYVLEWASSSCRCTPAVSGVRPKRCYAPSGCRREADA